jgi:hypothetical protein
MREAGLLDLAIAAAAGLDPRSLAGLGAPAAARSGVAPGSGVAGNALMMSAQYELGASVGRALDFAALQNAGAGHSSFASPPIVAVARAVAQTSGEGAVADAPLIHFGLAVAAAVLAALLLAAALLQ